MASQRTQRTQRTHWTRGITQRTVRPTRFWLAACCAALLGSLFVAVATTTSSAASEPASCRGLAVTIVGPNRPVTSGGYQPIEGTAGNDVIVTAGATQIAGRGGNDVICVAPATVADRDGTAPYLRLDAGPGDDVVDNTLSDVTEQNEITLGAGSDEFWGGAGADSVTTGPRQGTDAEPDLVVSGAGDDNIETGQPRLTTGDRLDLGLGDDYVLQSASGFDPAHPDAAMLGGEGINELRLADFRSPTVVDNAAGTVTVGGEQRFTMQGFTKLDVYAYDDFTIKGGPGAEVVYNGFFNPQAVLRVDLGEGDDAFYTDGAFNTGSTLQGGGGIDLLEAGTFNGELTVDLATGRYERAYRAQRTTARLSAWEKVDLSAERLIIKGTSAAETLLGGGCVTTLHGRGGDDELRPSSAFTWMGRDCRQPQNRAPSRLLGGPGDDVLRSNWRASILIGGPGRDRASGAGKGTRCDAEEMVRCRPM